MKRRALTLALCALGLLSATAANAQGNSFSYVVRGGSCGTNVMSYPAVVDSGCGLVTGAGACAAPMSCGTNVMSYPAVIDSGCGVATSCGAYAAPASCGTMGCAPLFGRHTYWDDGLGRFHANRIGYGRGLFGGLLGFGGGGYWGSGRYLGSAGYLGCNSLAAVVPNSCGARLATPPVCGQRLANSLFDIRLFRFGLGFGRVSPRWDMRPAGSAI